MEVVGGSWDCRRYVGLVGGFEGDRQEIYRICRKLGYEWSTWDLWEIDERQMGFARDVGGMGGVRCHEAYSSITMAVSL